MAGAQRKPIEGVATTKRVSRLSIGQVLTKLRPEFPDLAPSKLRYLEEQGIVSPERTESGYRKFTSEDVNRLRFALSLQRDQYLPLRVIKDQLDQLDNGNGEGFKQYLRVADPTTHQIGKLTHDAVAAEVGCTTKFVRECVSAGLLPKGATLPAEALRIIREVKALSEYGIEPRHLRTLRSIVEREGDIVGSVVEGTGARRTAASKAASERVVAEILSHLGTIHDGMISVLLGERDYLR